MRLEKGEVNSQVDQIVSGIGTNACDVIPILHAIQQKYNYLPELALRRVCKITDITPASLTSISTFYSQFRHMPVGKHIIQVCTGTACHVKGAESVWAELRKAFPVDYDESQSIGKRYRRQDEIGTPFCITYDFDSAEDGQVTVRHRDSMEQIRMPISEVKAYIEKHLHF